ncbi:MAG: hypothetical protein ACI9XO_004250 [Paraglaciecola sp.]
MGIQVTLEITDADFNKKSSSLYELSILLRMDSLVYAVSDQEGKILVLKQYKIASDIKDMPPRLSSFQTIFEKDALLKFLYRKCHIAFGNNLVALVPKRLFNPKRATTYLEELSNIDTTSKVDFNEITKLKTMVVYEQDSALQKFVKTAQPSSKIFHRTTPFLTGCTKKTIGSAQKIVFVNFRKSNFEVCFFDNGQLHFYNNFEFQSAADCLYYVLLVFEQFNLDQNKAFLQLSGEILEDSEIHKSLYRYIRNITFTTLPDDIVLNSTFRSVPAHYFFNLFALKLL